MKSKEIIRSGGVTAIPREAFLELRKVSLDDAKKQVLAYIDKHGPSFPADIALALKLDYALVLDALDQLRGHLTPES